MDGRTHSRGRLITWMVGAALLCGSAVGPFIPAMARDTAHAAAAAGVRYHNYSDGYFGVIVPDGWIVSDGRNGLEVSSPTGAARYEYGYAYGGPVGEYTLSQLTSLSITGLQLSRVKILQGPVTKTMSATWRRQTTELEGRRAGQLVLALVQTQIIDNADGEAIIAEEISAPAAQWRGFLPQLSTVQRSVRVLG
ncbi:MAG TPA: hypothetical protein VNL71_04505 [Chloroflexota bacterium]|nr:hypothetical protein [Chloroflexota bacterium]